jgi:uncharacterized membrane protein HdeD (DUF308 family)
MIVTSPVTEVRKWTRAQMEVVSRGWWVLLLTGLISLVAGAIIFFIDWTVGGLAVFVGTLLVVRGAFTTISIPIDGSMRTWSIVLGVVEMFVGLGVFLWPGPALLVVAFAIGWMLVFRGTMAIVGSISSRAYLPSWGVVLTAGILEVLVGLYLLSRPDITLIAAVLAIGFVSMLYGALEIVIAFEVKHLPDRFDDLIEQTGRDAAGQLNPIGR